MSSKTVKSKTRIYHEEEFKSLDHFIDFAGELMVTRAAVEQILSEPSEILFPFLKTVERRTLIEAFYNLDEDNIARLKNFLPKNEMKKFEQEWDSQKEPTAEDQWSAQKTLVTLFQRHKFTANS